MQIIHINSPVIRSQQWEQIWPKSFIAFIATGQMLLSFSIIAFETWSMVLNIKFAFLFIGYNSGLFFTITWISTFTVVCCKQESRNWATHAFIQNILSVIAASILLYYDSRFLQYPWTCIWPGKICSDINWNFVWSNWWTNYTVDVQDAKLLSIKIQLACTVFMLVFCLLFILTYIYTCLKVGSRSTIIIPQGTMETTPQY